MRPFPVTEFKLSKFATFLSSSMKTVQSIKTYCATLCEQNKLNGFRPVRRGIRFYKAIAGIKCRLHHRVKRAKPMTKDLLIKLQAVIHFDNDKELIVWSSLVTGFNIVVCKSNITPLKRVHDSVHNVMRSDVRYDEGVMVIMLRWSKTNQFGETSSESTLIGDNNSPICPVRWLLYMMEQIPAQGFHNLFSYRGKHGSVVPITYRDLMTYMRSWLDKIGEDSKQFSSHSLRRGATTHAHTAGIPEVEIQRLGNWNSDCYKRCIQEDLRSKITTRLMFNKN